ncbi:hypothetical protein PAXRUDRAFT_22456 [Paxillus rubicundulus Ve08.2h10]|uniref:Uncharacterized protein n=1 Tax=Paxillus rubicundulus Ve08.2h10 TaxID=930991 RepID=A0A0D0BK52_9AGAM|nr:hypothetical protein PAXRUDRAFT_22456 [Paxillus rubicundulus Ve08.2h10]
MDPRRPLLAFLASALPENHPELSSVLDNAEEYASRMVMTAETPACEVNARLVWVQVPSEGGVHLELVHRFEVEMEHNWYETTATASLPHHIVSVVDCASDSPMPLPVPSEEDKLDLVPVRGERLPNLGTFVLLGSNFDTVSSALGQGSGRRLGKALAGKKPKKGCHAKEEAAETYAPTPRNPRPPKFSKATYEVFPWGVNDPVEAAQWKAERHGQTEVEHPHLYGRETVKELGDTLASPAGWHTLPVSLDPGAESDRAAMGGRFVLAYDQHDLG